MASMGVIDFTQLNGVINLTKVTSFLTKEDIQVEVKRRIEDNDKYKLLKGYSTEEIDKFFE